MNKYLFFDVETSGLPKKYGRPYTDTDNYPRVVQLAYIITNEKGLILHKSMSVVKPEGYIIPANVSEVHGITTEDALNGFKMNYVIGNFISIVKNCDLLIAHNFKFDSIILACEAYRLNFSNNILDKPYTCTMLASTNYCNITGNKGRKKWPKLQELYNILFDKDFEGAHDALYDVEATVDCYFELVRLGVINEKNET
ncbi:hypothetical protein LCGC14_1679340 [marine sediment metagenome]|uniref:Exonuclease domain-containing protein n=1 Tax=marine sediment metagenome TaxID=412755 RepID=A0A0F9IBJ6_9ZZZZ